MKKIYLAVLVSLILAFQINAQSVTKMFRGFVSGAPIQMTLTRNGDQLTGNYFYTRIGKELKLVGMINEDGNFKLKETDATGKKTGEFTGKWMEEANSNGASLEGEWFKPNSQEGSGFIASEQMIEFTGNGKFSSKNFAEKNKLKRFEMTVEYPVLSGVNIASATKFNQLAKMRAMSPVADFRKAMMSQTKADLKSLPADNSFNVSYSVEWANENLVSISFMTSEYTGGAHGNYYTKTLNFDLKTGKEIKLADLFQPNSAYLKKISEYSIADLKTRLGETSDDEWITAGAGAKAENYAGWSLTKKGLMITFDPYQVAAYAAGMQTVIVPYSELGNVWRKDKMFAGN